MARRIGARTPELQGRTFASEYERQQAQAQARGFRSYYEYRQARAAARSLPPVQAPGMTAQQQANLQRANEQQLARLFREERKATRAGRSGILPRAERERLTNIVGQYAGRPGMRDRSIGGPLDMYLRQIGRRTGRETFPVGDTP